MQRKKLANHPFKYVCFTFLLNQITRMPIKIWNLKDLNWMLGLISFSFLFLQIILLFGQWQPWWVSAWWAAL